MKISKAGMGRIGPWAAMGVAWLSLASPAAAQQGNAPAARSELGSELQQVRSHFGPAVAGEIENVVASARAAGVPESLVLKKALEGAAKGVPGARVVDVLRTYQSRLVRSRALLGSTASGAMLVAGADALQKGVPEAAVQSVGRAEGGDPIALVALGDLVDAGVPVDQAAAVVRKALARGKRGEELLDIPAQVRNMMRQGTPPGQAAGVIGKSLDQGGPPGGPPGRGVSVGKGHGGGPGKGGPPSGVGGPGKGPGPGPGPGGSGGG